MIQYKLYPRAVFRRERRLLRPIKPRCTITEDILFSSASKFISSTVCYPIESIRMLLLSSSLESTCNIQTPLETMKKLYSGYRYFVPYNIFHSVSTYIILYYSLSLINGPLAYSQSLLIASSITCLLTSFYKVPCTYIIRRKLVTDHVCIKHLMDFQYFSKAILAMLLEDIPDIYIKFYLNHILKQTLSGIMPPVYISILVGLFACILLTPFEFIKTKVIYYDMNIVQNKFAIYIRVLNSISNTAMFFSIIEIFKTASKQIVPI